MDKAASILDHPLHWRWALPALLLLLVFPLLASAADAEFYVTLASRILIFALAATSLNLISGFGGMVSFGHAAFVGVGAYAVAIAMQHGLGSAWIVWPLAMGVSALFALVIGAISLRTQGVYFIMITLAFAQMLYFLAVSIKTYGGDDGLQMLARSTLGGGVDLTRDRDFYYVTLLLVVLSIYAVARLLNARFGHVLQAIRENETRMKAIGFPVYRYKLVASSASWSSVWCWPPSRNCCCLMSPWRGWGRTSLKAWWFCCRPCVVTSRFCWWSTTWTRCSGWLIRFLFWLPVK